MFNEEVLNLYINTALERHRIYVKKESGASKPWTEDRVFQQFFFCNLFRQYDKCTKWIIDNVIPFERWDLIILYRFISTYELFEEIKRTCSLDDLDGVYKYLEHRKSLGPMFNGCFFRNPRIIGGWTEKWKVPFHTIHEIKKEGHFQETLEQNSLELLVQYLQKFSGIGGFMGYEYACDMEYWKGFNPTDKYTWANMGPGAKKGMSLVRWGFPGRQMTQDEWLEGARELFVILKKRVEAEFPEEDVSMREVEHWLCEFAKYGKYLGVLSQGHKVKYRHYGGMYD